MKARALVTIQLAVEFDDEVSDVESEVVFYYPEEDPKILRQLVHSTNIPMDVDLDTWLIEP